MTEIAELTEEEIEALKKIEAWVKGDWRDNCQAEGYFEACVVGLLLERFSKLYKELADEVINALSEKTSLRG